MSLFSQLGGLRSPHLRAAVDEIDRMLALAEEMFEAATVHLLDNEPLDLDLAARDQLINEAEQTVRRMVLEHVVGEGDREPVLPFILVAVVQEVEQVGDLIKALAGNAALAAHPRLGPAVVPLRRLRDGLRPALADTRRAFGEADAAAAQSVMDHHETVLDATTAYLRETAASAELSTNEAVVLALSARMLRRISSHLANIVSPVLVPFDQIRRPSL